MEDPSVCQAGKAGLLYTERMDRKTKSIDQPLRADAQRNRKRLIQVAQSSIAEIGPDTPLEDIARRAEVGIGTLYRHFPTRLDLLEAVCEDQRGALIRLAGELKDSDRSEEAFVRWLQAALEKMVTFRALKFVMASDFSEVADPAHDWKRRMLEAVGGLLRAAEKAGEIRENVDVERIFRLLNAIAAAAEKAKDPVLESRQLLDVVVDGLRTR
jgi:AcrR family transcriptional regulator